MFKRKKKRAIVARKLVTSVNPKSIISEQYKTIRTNINFSMPDKKIQTLLFTSSMTGEGKSTTAANVAIAFAQEGKQVILIDADMRKPTMHYTFHTTSSVGLSNVLVGQWNYEDVIKGTEIQGMDLITCGHIPSNPAELLNSKSMDVLLGKLKTQYDMIIFDAPPVLLIADAQILSNKCDATVLVINSGITKKEHVLKATDALQKSNATIIGTILNNFKLEKGHYYKEYYGEIKKMDKLIVSAGGRN